MNTIKNEQVTSELVYLIQKGSAHATFDEAVAELPAELRTKTPEGLPYSIWQLTEHIRITQWDIVEFCISADHKSPKWPDEYWPAPVDKVTDKAWETCLKQIASDRKRFIKLITEKDADLFTPFSHGSGQNLLREALLIADHTAYHVGEIIVLRRLLKSWKS